MFRKSVLVLSGCLLIAAGCGYEGGYGGNTEDYNQPIVGGTPESGWSNVGALTVMHPGYGYLGSFCTGTVIAPQWVLTAGHCLENDMGGMIPLTPGIVRFYVGSNANSPAPGSLHEVDAFFVHPSYSDNPLLNDIALVRLKQPIAGVTPTSINTAAMQGSWVGAYLLYVGFGVNDGVNSTGGGIKRRGEIKIHGIDTRTYTSIADEGVGVCYGDSGGPGLGYFTDETWRVVGVNSATSGGHTDPCLGYGIHTRVDYYDTWISSITGGQLPDCNDDPNMCFCADACLANGTCDNSLCEIYSCAQIYMCMGGCSENDDGCYVDCYLKGTSQGRADFDAINHCAHANNCFEAADYQVCMETNCQGVLDDCFEASTGDLTCEEMYECFGDCQEGDQACTWACYESGTAEAQQQYNDMAECFETQCGGIDDQDQWLNCVYTNCAEELEGCFIPDNCNILGGDCGSDRACYPTPGGNTNCYNSDGVGLGESCDPNLTDRLSCGDGLVCASWKGNVCVQFCFENVHCGTDETCSVPIFQDIDDLGYCDSGGSPSGDASVPDGWVPSGDGGWHTDDGGIGSPDGHVHNGEATGGDGGCGCRASGKDSAPSLFLLLTALFGLLVVRKRSCFQTGR